MGDTLAAKAARLRSVFLTRGNCDTPSVSVPQRKQGDVTVDAAPTVNWRTVQSNLQTLLATQSLANVALAQNWADQTPAQQYWGTP